MRSGGRTRDGTEKVSTNLGLSHCRTHHTANLYRAVGLRKSQTTSTYITDSTVLSVQLVVNRVLLHLRAGPVCLGYVGGVSVCRLLFTLSVSYHHFPTPSDRGGGQGVGSSEDQTGSVWSRFRDKPRPVQGEGKTRVVPPPPRPDGTFSSPSLNVPSFPSFLPLTKQSDPKRTIVCDMGERYRRESGE